MKKPFTQYHVNDADELDVFDDYEAYLETDGYFYVIQGDTGEQWYPIWNWRDDKIIDHQGWSDEVDKNLQKYDK